MGIDSAESTPVTSRPAICLSGVTKQYPLYASPMAQALESLGLRRARGAAKTALDDVTLRIEHGEKVGVIGRNGSGKTTLLRLIIRHTFPTHGSVEVDGATQAMMQTGFGFHDEMTGIDNVNNALIYNGLTDAERSAAVADIIDFVELHEFIQSPLKTYSLGMRARLEFATATAIHPQILAIDEVLGAGDGYFVRKCAERMRRVISDSTLVLVSHALDQIRDYCTRVIWLDEGRVVDDGPTGPVIKAYQLFMSRMEAALQRELRDRDEKLPGQPAGQAWRVASVLGKVRERFLVSNSDAEPEITACNFQGENSDRLVIETGDALSVTFSVRARKPISVEPVLLGMSEHGALVFEAVGPGVEVTGVSDITLCSARAGIGVGNYVLVPALRACSDRRLLALGAMELVLRLLPTNWNDPPLVHLQGHWRSGAARLPVASKISAWV